MNVVAQIIILSVVFCTSCFGQANVYKNSVGHYEVNYFDGWLPLEEQAANIAIYAPTAPGDREREHIRVVVSPAHGMSLESLYRDYETNVFPSAFPHFKKIREGDWEITGNKAKWIEYSETGGEVAMMYLCSFIVKNDNAFILIAFSSTSGYGGYEERFRAMMRSFKIN